MAKKNRKNNENNGGNNNLKHFVLKNVNPMTRNQRLVFEHYNTNQNLVLHGVAGTGKSYISIYLALNDIINDMKYKQLIIVRSVVPTRDMGFLPGSPMEKSKEYEKPYKVICDDLFGRGDGYDILKMKKIVNFTTTSFVRGMTFDNSIVFVDEINNMTFHELDSIITRVGENCKVIFSGDYRQSDLKFQDERAGLLTFLKILDRMPEFTRVEFGIDDIVRSGLVKSYIINKLKIESEI